MIPARLPSASRGPSLSAKLKAGGANLADLAPRSQIEKREVTATLNCFGTGPPVPVFPILESASDFGFVLAALSLRRSGSDFGLRISDFQAPSSSAFARPGCPVLDSFCPTICSDRNNICAFAFSECTLPQGGPPRRGGQAPR